MSEFPGNWPECNLDAARALIAACNEVRNANANETVVRQTLIAHLADVFPIATRPWWVVSHIRGAESQLAYTVQGQQRFGAADSVVGLTAIEYKSDLRRRGQYRTGRRQLRRYAAGLLNDGSDADDCRLVLSDSVEWLAFGIERLEAQEIGQYALDDVCLTEVERLTCTRPDDAVNLVAFLARYLGREGTRPLTGSGISANLGIASPLGQECVGGLLQIIAEFRTADPQAADIALRIRREYASYLGTGGNDPDELGTYACECYLAIVARLICANAIASRALPSAEDELDRILDGSYFAAMGLRLVEHDQFDWLLRGQADALRSVASTIQTELIAYDFESAPTEDLFGELLTGLADPETRILLGQACTPMWLALFMAQRLIEMLPEGEPPRFVDMCCGSGAMLVAATQLERERLDREGIAPNSRIYMERLTAAATGFDINPLAVMLARINWVISNREVLDATIVVSPPVYHADSLFALAPVFAGNGDTNGATSRRSFRLHNVTIFPPTFLLEPTARELFEALLERCRNMAEALAGTQRTTPAPNVVSDAVCEAVAETAYSLNDAGKTCLIDFVAHLVTALARLEMEGRDGIWSFVLGNSYRPAFYAGRFNGLLSNPPWLAMSKIGGNPFRPVIQRLSRRYRLTPTGSSSPHLEMSTVFLARATEWYLEDNGVVACVLPDTVRNGQHHKPFRQLSTCSVSNAHFRFRLEELWRIDKNTFENLAAVVLGRKARPIQMEQIPGRTVSRQQSEETRYTVRSAGNRIAWCSSDHGGVAQVSDSYEGVASQGADLMPRRLLFFDVEDQGRNAIVVSPIRADSAHWQLIAKAKKHSQFSIQTTRLPARFAQQCLLSLHLGPFVLAKPSRAILPILRESDYWRPVSDEELGATPRAREHFRAVVQTSDFGSVSEFWAGLDMRGKMSSQRWQPGKWRVVYAAGGEIPTAAYELIRESPSILDQTLYGFSVDTEDEAVYFTGVVNSPVLRERIACFVPQGKFGGRHLHTLPQYETPMYDPRQETHTAVVDATRALMRELSDRSRDDREIVQLFTIVISLETRRRRMRALIESLPAYQQYEDATRRLYATMPT